MALRVGIPKTCIPPSLADVLRPGIMVCAVGSSLKVTGVHPRGRCRIGSLAGNSAKAGATPRIATVP